MTNQTNVLRLHTATRFLFVFLFASTMISRCAGMHCQDDEKRTANDAQDQQLNVAAHQVLEAAAPGLQRLPPAPTNNFCRKIKETLQRFSNNVSRCARGLTIRGTMRSLGLVLFGGFVASAIVGVVKESEKDKAITDLKDQMQARTDQMNADYAERLRQNEQLCITYYDDILGQCEKELNNILRNLDDVDPDELPQAHPLLINSAPPPKPTTPASTPNGDDAANPGGDMRRLATTIPPIEPFDAQNFIFMMRLLVSIAFIIFVVNALVKRFLRKPVHNDGIEKPLIRV